MTDTTFLATVISITSKQNIPHLEPEPMTLTNTQAKQTFPEKFIKQKDNTQYDETDFLPTPLLGPNIKRREDNHVNIWIHQDDKKIIQ